MTFEERLARLEAVVKALEGSGPLDVALDLYEEGVELARACAKELETGERRIEQLTVGPDGVARLTPFLEAPP